MRTKPPALGSSKLRSPWGRGAHALPVSTRFAKHLLLLLSWRGPGDTATLMLTAASTEVSLEVGGFAGASSTTKRSYMASQEISKPRNGWVQQSVDRRLPICLPGRWTDTESRAVRVGQGQLQISRLGCQIRCDISFKALACLICKFFKK